MIPALVVLVVLLLIVTLKAIVVVPNDQVWVVERLGRVHRRITEGIAFIAPFIDRIAERYALDATPVPFDVQVISHDNTPVRLTGSATYRIDDVPLVHTSVPDVPSAVAQLVRTALIDEAGKRSVDEMREEGRMFRSGVQSAAGAIAEKMGLKIVAVELEIAR